MKDTILQMVKLKRKRGTKTKGRRKKQKEKEARHWHWCVARDIRNIRKWDSNETQSKALLACDVWVLVVSSVAGRHVRPLMTPASSFQTIQWPKWKWYWFVGTDIFYCLKYKIQHRDSTGHLVYLQKQALNKHINTDGDSVSHETFGTSKHPRLMGTEVFNENSWEKNCKGDMRHCEKLFF